MINSVFSEMRIVDTLVSDSQEQQSEDLTALTAEFAEKLKIELKNGDLSTSSDKTPILLPLEYIYSVFGGLTALLTPCVFR